MEHAPMANAARDAGLVERSERLAEALWDESRRLRAPAERRQAERIARLLEDPAGFAVILALTDEVLRIRQPRRAARHFRSIVRSAGTPRFMGPIDRAALGAAVALAGALAPIVMPMVTARVRRELAGFVIDAEPRRLRRHIQRRRDQGVRLNLNLLGEAILGDDEAERRLQRVLDLLERPDVDYVSVKVSSICAQLNPVAFDQEVDRIANQLRRLYDAALRHEPAKFVNRDMEEFRDLGLTVESFRRVLDEETYASLDAGIVLQAYIPESLPELAQLCTWARARRDSGGGLVKVRIVKGANLAMERVEAELTGWPQAPLDSKSRVDANYKRMLDLALDPSNRGALRVGVASHNVFELAWALTVSRDRKLDDMVDAEMLEGMAPSVALALRREAGGLLLYAPIAARADSESAIAYLVRRFDENTGPENFLRHQYALTPGDPVWEAERSRFEAAVAKRHARPEGARRTQDRGRPPEPRTTDAARGFVNEPDTDFSLVANRVWLSEELGSPRGSIPQVVAARVAGRWVEAPATGRGLDPGRPGEVAYTWVQATTDLVGEATAAARPAGERWRRLSHSERGVVVARVGDVLNQRRGRLIACMAVEGGKTVAEADPEVSEAVDFARYYAAGVA
ncbi:MAG: proline dehydrogenase family protein, partial [Acidimicrobiales bacterium]